MRIGSGKQVVTNDYKQSYKAWLNRGTGWDSHLVARKKTLRDCVGDREMRYAYLLWLLHADDMTWVNKRL